MITRLTTLPDSIELRQRSAQLCSVGHELYQRGASYVVLPHFLGGRFASELVRKYGSRNENYAAEREAHLRNLKERLARGHEHPAPEALR